MKLNRIQHKIEQGNLKNGIRINSNSKQLKPLLEVSKSFKINNMEVVQMK